VIESLFQFAPLCRDLLRNYQWPDIGDDVLIYEDFATLDDEQREQLPVPCIAIFYAGETVEATPQQQITMFRQLWDIGGYIRYDLDAEATQRNGGEIQFRLMDALIARRVSADFNLIGFVSTLEPVFLPDRRAAFYGVRFSTVFDRRFGVSQLPDRLASFYNLRT